MSTILENTDGWFKQYRCASALYLMSVMYQCYSIIIGWVISAPGHVKEVVDGLNDVYKCYIYQLMSTVKLHGSNRFDSQTQMHIGTQKDDIILFRGLQDHLTKEHHINGVFDHGKNKKIFMERKYTDRQYHVHNHADVAHKL